MKWYAKYLPVYEKPFAEAPAAAVAEMRANWPNGSRTNRW